VWINRAAEQQRSGTIEGKTSRIEDNLPHPLLGKEGIKRFHGKEGIKSSSHLQGEVRWGNLCLK